MQNDGVVKELFALKHIVYASCAINEGDSVVVTGGWYSVNTVSRYNINGWTENLPNLLGPRVYHACGHYLNSDNQKVYN